MTILFAVAAAAALVALVWWYRRERANDVFKGIMSRHRDARICSKAELVDGRNHIPVALTLEQSQIYYQNADLDATVDIDHIEEVEYASDLLTGGISSGAVLRLRAHGRAMEFVLDFSSAEKWAQLLPPHRMGEAGIVHAV